MTKAVSISVKASMIIEQIHEATIEAIKELQLPYYQIIPTPARNNMKFIFTDRIITRKGL